MGTTALDRRLNEAATSGTLAALCGRYGIAQLLVFGSVARGDAKPDSDIDLLYELVPGCRLGFALNALEDELAELLGRPVDLVSQGGIHPLLEEQILADAVELYAA